MKYSTPEKCGISTDSIKRYIDKLESNGLSTHSLIIMRGDSVILEKYWKPFEREFRHRMYSVSKSFVAIAVGFLADEGKISLDDAIMVYFPTECEKVTDENIKKQTIREMLMMRTAYPKNAKNWFEESPDDRVMQYFTSNSGSCYPSGTLFKYDSSGSFVLGALVERVTGKNIIDYLDEKLFSKIGVEGAYSLKCPGGHSWMDSGLMMRPIDLARCARFILDSGSYRGEQLLSERYVKEATSYLVPTTHYGESTYEDGYGYLIWRTKHNSILFNGMGCQLAICNPDKDLILVYNGDNQGIDVAKSLIIDGFFDIIYNEARDEELPEYTGEPIGENSLFSLPDRPRSELEGKIGGKRYILEPNKMCIEELTLDFTEDGGELQYVNKTGAKTLPFLFGKNAFVKFPEDGYSDMVGSKAAPGNKYGSAVSASWLSDNFLMIRIQVIDKYFGNLVIRLSFKDDKIAVAMEKRAENFFGEYQGTANGKME